MSKTEMKTEITYYEGKRFTADSGWNGKSCEGEPKVHFNICGGHCCSASGREDLYVYIPITDENGETKKVYFTINIKTGNGELYHKLNDKTGYEPDMIDFKKTCVYKNKLMIYSPVQDKTLYESTEELMKHFYLIPTTDFMEFVEGDPDDLFVHYPLVKEAGGVHRKCSLHLKFYERGKFGNLPKRVVRFYDFLSRYPTAYDIGSGRENLIRYIKETFF